MSDHPQVAKEGEERAEPAARITREPRIIGRAEHSISRKHIPENVLKVLYRLQRSGYRAYLCGGSVRDLLLGRTPKDFDVATNAKPGELRRLFRNSRIIGRRFRLVHVVFQDRFVEVSTFRREPEGQSDGDDLLVRRDNTFGNPVEDALRRDFTINGLFYNIDDFTVIDYAGGIDDLEARLIRVIGDPDVRFREDPVRMMRAVEFAARLDFEIEADTYDAILRHREEILKASPVRVTEEILELLRRGWSYEAMNLILETGLAGVLFPELVPIVEREDFAYFWKMLAVLDRTMRSGKEIPDAVLVGVLLVPLVFEHLDREEGRRGERLRVGEVLPLIREILEPFFLRLALPGGMRHQIEQAFETIWRLLEPPGDRRSRWRFAFREHFDNGMLLFELYSFSSGRYLDTFRAWQDLLKRVKREDPPEPKRRMRRRKKRRVS